MNAAGLPRDDAPPRQGHRGEDMTIDLEQPRVFGVKAALAGGERRERASRSPVSDHVATIAVVVAIVAVMQVGSLFIPAYILPSPLSVVRSLAESLATDYGQILITLLRLVVSLLISIAV